MYLYSLSPIDWWQGWMTEEQFEKNCEEIYGPTEMGSAMAAYKVFRQKAFALAKENGWEGDVREGPFVAGLPPSGGDSQSAIMICWKQDNNGETFVVSPYPLPWLDE